MPINGSVSSFVLSLQLIFVENTGGKCFLVPTHHLRRASSNICFSSHSLVLRFQRIVSNENQLTITARALTPTSACLPVPKLQLMFIVITPAHSRICRLVAKGSNSCYGCAVFAAPIRSAPSKRLPASSWTGFGTANKPIGSDTGEYCHRSERLSRFTVG